MLLLIPAKIHKFVLRHLLFLFFGFMKYQKLYLKRDNFFQLQI